MKIQLFIGISLTLIGCASNTAKKVNNIYEENSQRQIQILRPDTRVASAVGIEIYINNEQIATIKKNSILTYPIKPNSYKLRIGDGAEKDLFFAQEIDIDVKNNSLCIVLIDEFIDDQRGPHISLKPLISNLKECQSSTLEKVPYN